MDFWLKMQLLSGREYNYFSWQVKTGGGAGASPLLKKIVEKIKTKK